MTEDIRAVLRTAGLTRVASQCEQLMTPSIRMRRRRVQEESMPLGTSKLGGLPDLPPEWPWPCWKHIPLAFLAQINLAEVQSYDLVGRLPPRGMLYFFYDAYHRPVGYDPASRGGWQVSYYDGTLTNLQRMLVPSVLLEQKSLWLPEEQHYVACALTFSREMTLPPDHAPTLEALQLSEQEVDRYLDVLHSLQRQDHQPIHRLLGYPDALQGDMQIESQLVSHGVYLGDATASSSTLAAQLRTEAQNWQLLLQLDTDDEAAMVWGIEGRIYYWIETQALGLRQFEKTWFIMQWT